jgi:hypothetical protein
MKLYIANCTKQVWIFSYRVPGTDLMGKPFGVRQQEIPEGGQIQISGDLQPEEITYIIEQNARYGLIQSEEIDRTRPFAGLCYSIGKPIAVPKIEKLFMHNQEVLEERSEEKLRDTALANNQLLKNRLQSAARDAGRKMPAIGEFETALSEESKSPSKTKFFSDGKKRASSLIIKGGDDDAPRRGRVA